MRAFTRMRCECAHFHACDANARIFAHAMRMRACDANARTGAHFPACDAMRCECAHAMRCECAHQGGTYACPVLYNWPKFKSVSVQWALYTKRFSGYDDKKFSIRLKSWLWITEDRKPWVWWPLQGTSIMVSLTRRSENDNTPQPLDQWTNSPFMGQ